MVPVDIETRHGVYVILHRCVECGHERKNKVVADDNINAIMMLAQQAANGALSHTSRSRDSSRSRHPQRRSHRERARR
jgi:hypothetical protein